MTKPITEYDKDGRMIYHSNNKGYEYCCQYNEDGSKLCHYKGHYKESYGEDECWIKYDKEGIPIYHEDVISGYKEWLNE